ncbi:lymphocyte antigen 6D [Myotis yumanensis]|uniref:lymphocyte antigen 6D n=1 Tax=Myotis yumanensis TaxID=159337 RepID=UPI0038D465B0
MKTVLLLLLVLAAAMGPAQALRCHVCNSATNCKKPENCQASARYCRTLTRVEPLSGNLVEKNCVETCTPTNTRPGQVTSGTVTWCCQGDLCNERLHNSAPGRPLLASTALGLGLALGLLALTLAPSL